MDYIKTPKLVIKDRDSLNDQIRQYHNGVITPL